MRRLCLFLTSALLLFSSSLVVLADAAPGDIIVTLGESLSEQQRTDILNELKVPADVQTVIVTNEEERKYLGKYIPPSQIGTRALSSSKITITDNQGLNVEVKNITWVTEEMYTNALVTAGVKNADIYITAPFPVSGTAALTGIIKAYEVAAGEVIPEEQKDVANEEMVLTGQLGDQVGKDEANNLMTNIKEHIAANPNLSSEEIENIVRSEAQQLNISLTDEQIASLVAFFDRLKNLDINWGKLQDDLQNAKQKFDNFIQSDEGQTLIAQIKTFFQHVLDIIQNWFGQ